MRIAVDCRSWSLVALSTLCLLIIDASGGIALGQDNTASPSVVPAGQVPWGELDLDSILNRPLDANRSMSRLKTDRRFLDESSIPDTTRLQFGDGSPYLWEGTGYAWHSPAFCHSPLYFEQPNLERYGQGPCRPWASTVSATRFVGQVTTLPLAVIWSPPWSRSCTLGHHRPGDLAPWQRKTSSH
jgi:hypothetical protein